MKDPLASHSKFLSLVLRHKPEEIDLALDPQGWVAVDVLITRLNEHGKVIDRALLERIVRENNKQRFAFSEDGQRIRANQGHSVVVELDLPPQSPPPVLYHGTATRFAEPIREQGLLKMQRRHVHLSPDIETASKVGLRHGKLLILGVDAAQMAADGYVFYVSANGVWLTDAVPAKYLQFPETVED